MERLVAILPTWEATKMGDIEIMRLNPENIIEHTDGAKPDAHCEPIMPLFS